MKTTILFLAMTALAACAPEDGTLPGDDEGSGTRGGGETTTTTTGAACTPGKAYATFGGDELGADRVKGANAGLDRRRMKSYAALSSEYKRVLGAPPASLAKAGDTFGEPAKRWFSEPSTSAVAIHTNYLIAYEGCLTYLNGASYDAEPTDQAARTVCGDLGRKFWSRDLVPTELDTCATLATTGVKSETSAKRKWAHVCASMLSSAGFLTY